MYFNRFIPVRRSNRPDQILQFVEVTSLLLPTLDADVPDGIADRVQQMRPSAKRPIASAFAR
jgi:hypothetical protein